MSNPPSALKKLPMLHVFDIAGARLYPRIPSSTELILFSSWNNYCSFGTIRPVGER